MAKAERRGSRIRRSQEELIRSGRIRRHENEFNEVRGCTQLIRSLVQHINDQERVLGDFRDIAWEYETDM